MSVNSPQFKYGVPDSNPGSAFASKVSQAPESPVSLQEGTNQSNAFIFRSKHLNPNKPNALSKDTRSDVYGGRAQQAGMGA
jgi:hypothetical protein